MTARTTGVSYTKIPALLPKWLWKPYYPLGELTLNVAKGGTGKTTEMADLTARVTRGRAWPDGTPGGPPSSVIWITLEDDPTMLKWKFMAAGADDTRITDLSDVDGRPFYLDGTRGDSLAALEDKIVELGDVRLVVIDTLRKASRLNLRDEVKAAMILMPLISLARRYGVAIVANHHTVKDGSVAGSGALVDTARHVIMITGDDGMNELGIHKTNIAPRDTDPLYYEIVGEDTDAHVDWLDEDAVAQTPEKAAALVLEQLRNADSPLTEQQLTTSSGVPYAEVRVVIDSAVQRHEVMSAGQDTWEIAPYEGRHAGRHAGIGV